MYFYYIMVLNKTVGTRAEVWHGTAKKTSGGLMKKDLKMNKRGRIVSLKMSNRAKKEKRLEKAGYKTKKGKFKLFKKKKRRKQKGGGKKEDKALLNAARSDRYSKRKHKYAAMVQALDDGANPYARDDRGHTALWYVEGRGQIKMVQLLLDRALIWVANFKVRPDYTAMVQALNDGANPNARDDSGYTALWYAAGKGQIKMVRLLLERGANADEAGPTHTPIGEAASRGHLDIVRLLIDNGADVNQGGNGHSVLFYVMLSERSDAEVIELCKELLSRGVHDLDMCLNVAMKIQKKPRCANLIREEIARRASVITEHPAPASWMKKPWIQEKLRWGSTANETSTVDTKEEESNEEPPIGPNNQGFEESKEEESNEEPPIGRPIGPNNQGYEKSKEGNEQGRRGGRSLIKKTKKKLKKGKKKLKKLKKRIKKL